jgi:hypothetical protein
MEYLIPVVCASIAAIAGWAVGYLDGRASSEAENNQSTKEAIRKAKEICESWEIMIEEMDQFAEDMKQKHDICGLDISTRSRAGE